MAVYLLALMVLAGDPQPDDQADMVMRGKVVLIDAERREVMVEANQVMHVFAVAADAVIVRGDETVRLGTLRPGHQVTVYLKAEEDANPIVRRIEVGPLAK